MFLPSASLLYCLTDRVSVYGSYSTSYHPNASVPAAGPVPASGPFAPEKGEGWEAGAKAEFLGGKLLTTAALFRIDKTNVLTTSDDVTSTVGSVRAQGGELTVSGQVTPAFNLTASYTYLDAKVRDDPTLGGNRFVNVPPTRARSSVRTRSGRVRSRDWRRARASPPPAGSPSTPPTRHFCPATPRSMRCCATGRDWPTA